MPQLTREIAQAEEEMEQAERDMDAAEEAVSAAEAAMAAINMELARLEDLRDRLRGRDALRCRGILDRMKDLYDEYEQLLEQLENARAAYQEAEARWDSAADARNDAIGDRSEIGGGWRSRPDGRGLGGMYGDDTFELETTRDGLLARLRQKRDGKVVSEDVGGLVGQTHQEGVGMTSSRNGTLSTYAFNGWERYLWLYDPWEMHIPVETYWHSTKWWGDDGAYLIVRLTWGNRIQSR